MGEYLQALASDCCLLHVEENTQLPRIILVEWFVAHVHTVAASPASVHLTVLHYV